MDWGRVTLPRVSRRKRSVAAVALLPWVAACSPDSEGGARAATSPPKSAGVETTDRARPASHPHNLVLITIDTLRADHLSCYGYQRRTTPRFDELAQKGTLFEQAMTQWPKTSPAVASLLTSTYGSTSGVARTTLDKKVPLSYELLPELLHAAGYETLGAVANMSLSPTFHFDQGFDHFEAINRNADATGLGKLARELLARRDRSRPYLLWLHYLDPHAPYLPPARCSKDFVGDALYEADVRPPVPIDPVVRDPHAPKQECNDLGQVPAYAYMPGKNHIRDYVAQYDGDIRYVDEQVGALLDEMRNDGHLDGAIVVLTADHGEALGGHNYFFEHGRFPYDDCLRVPLIVVHPEWQPARVSSPVGLIDLAPTLLEMVGVEPGWQFQGRSRLAWLRAGAPEEQAAPVFSESGYIKAFEVSIHKGRHKLIKLGSRYLAEMLTGAPYELYDVLADPDETKNLVDEQPELFESLRVELDAYARIAYARVPPPPDDEAFRPTAEELEIIRSLGYGNDQERTKQGDPEPAKQGGGG